MEPTGPQDDDVIIIFSSREDYERDLARRQVDHLRLTANMNAQTIYTRKLSTTVLLDFLGTSCRAMVTIHETFDLLNGDSSSVLSVVDIISLSDGQEYFTNNLSPDQFREMMRAVRGKIQTL